MAVPHFIDFENDFYVENLYKLDTCDLKHVFICNIHEGCEYIVCSALWEVEK